MSSPDDMLPPKRLRVMQIIAGALLLGVLTFLAIALFLVSGRPQGAAGGTADGLPVISVLAVMLLVVDAPLAFVVPSFLMRSAVRRIASGAWQAPPGSDPAAFASDAAKLLTVRQTALIIGLALLEGVAFFACIAYLLEAQPFVLAVVLVAVALMLVNFPTEGRVRAWLERQADLLAELRQQGDIPAER